MLLASISSATVFEDQGWPPEDTDSPYGMMVEMEDGTRLATLVFLEVPYNDSLTGPTLLTRSPYNVSGSWMTNGAASLMSSYDVTVVAQDMRGRSASEGLDTAFGDDWQDGRDTLEWLGSEEAWWSNGKVGTYGKSASAITQYSMAGEGVDGLHAQVISLGTPEQYDHFFFPGGQFRYNTVRFWATRQGSETLDFITDIMMQHPSKDDWWGNRSLVMGDRYPNVNASGVHSGGWDDIFSAGTLEGFMGYNGLGDVGAQGHQILVMRGIGHSGLAGEITWPEAAVMPALVISTQNGSSNGIGDFLWKADLFDEFGPRGSPGYEDAWSRVPRVHYYVYSDPELASDDETFTNWRTSDTWPVAHTDDRWHLAAGVDQWNGVLDRQLPSSPGSITYTYDPEDPCPTNGGANLISYSAQTGRYIGMGSTDQRGLGSSKAPGITDRSDVVSFIAGSFDEPYEFVGTPVAHISVQSTAPDTDLVVKLVDVFPDGREMLVSDGILRTARMRGFDTTTWMEAGETYEMDVELRPTAWRFQPGHSMKVIVTSSNYPAYQRNPNLREEVIPYTITEWQTADNTILLSKDEPSFITLPVTLNADPVPTVRLNHPTEATSTGMVDITWSTFGTLEETTLIINGVVRSVNSDGYYLLETPIAGTNVIEIRVMDTSGKVANDTLSFTYPLLPSIEILSPLNGSRVSTDKVVLSWSAPTSIIRTEIILNDASFVTLTNDSRRELNITDLSEGENTIRIVGTDLWNRDSEDTVVVDYAPEDEEFSVPSVSFIAGMAVVVGMCAGRRRK